MRRAVRPESRSRPSGCLALIVLGLVALGVTSYRDGPPVPPGGSSTVALTDPGPPGRARPTDAQFQRAVFALAVLRKSLHNPASLDVAQILDMDDESLCITFRARNAFNAMILNHAVVDGLRILATGDPGFERSWNRHCGGRSGRDLTYARRALL